MTKRVARDLTGLSFGDITVVGRAEIYNKWRCRCVCGTIFETYATSILHGKHQGCWCKRRKRAKVAVTHPDVMKWPKVS